MTTGILWFLALGALVYFMMKNGGGCCGGHDHGGDGQGGKGDHSGHQGVQRLDEAGKTEASALRDPVCGTAVNGNAASLTSEHLGRTFHFCSEQCRKIFDLHPNKFVGSIHG